MISQKTIMISLTSTECVNWLQVCQMQRKNVNETNAEKEQEERTYLRNVEKYKLIKYHV